MIITINRCLVPECDGASHKWEFEAPTLREIQRMEQVSGISIDQFAGGLDDALDAGITSAGINAVLALVDMLHRRDGVRVPFEEIDVSPTDFQMDFEVGELEANGDEAEETESGEGKDPAPTPDSPPPAEPAPAEPASGPETVEGSEARSSSTPTGSGGGSDSP